MPSALRGVRARRRARNSAGVARADDLLGAIAEHALRARVEDGDRPLRSIATIALPGRGVTGRRTGGRGSRAPRPAGAGCSGRRSPRPRAPAARCAACCRGSCSPPISAHGSSSTTSGRRRARSAAGAGVPYSASHTAGRITSGRKPAGPSPACAHQRDDAQVGERQPQLRGLTGAHGRRATPITSSAERERAGEPEQQRIDLRPREQRRRAGRRRPRAPKASAGAAARFAVAHGQPSTTRSTISAATSDHDRQLAPEQAALEALVGGELASKSSLTPGLPPRRSSRSSPTPSPRAAARRGTPRR